MYVLQIRPCFSDSCGFRSAWFDIYEIYINNRTFTGYGNAVSLFFTVLKTTESETCVGPCALLGGPPLFKLFLTPLLLMLLSFVVLQSKPLVLRGKYVQRSEAQVLLLNSCSPDVVLLINTCFLPVILFLYIFSVHIFIDNYHETHSTCFSSP